MAGRRQHYLPRLLQRGFLDAGSGEVERTWLHRQGGPPRLVSIRDVGVGEYFYSRPQPGEITLDDVITDLEGDISKAIDGYRVAGPGERVDAATAARTVHHLITRTAHIRSLLADASKRFFEEIEAVLTAPGQLAVMLGLDSTNLSPVVLDKIREMSVMLTTLGLPEAFSERLLAFYIREKAPALLAETSAPMVEAFQSIMPAIARMVRESHDKMLFADPTEHLWMQRLSKFDWHVAESADLILPDCVGLVSDGARSLAPLLFCDGETAALVAMPVAPNRILIGMAPGMAMIDLANFNFRAAACSNNFFIAVEPVEDMSLARLIGTEGALAIDSAIADTMARVGAIDTSATCVVAELSATEADFSYTLRLDGFGDQALAEQLNEVIYDVVSILARRLPLASLDGFTLAADYVAALGSVDRGADLPPIETAALAYGAGVANSVPVVRDGTARTHIVIAAGVASSWLDDDPAIRAGALNILVKMLAYIGHDAGYRDQLAAARFEPDLITSMLHPAVGAAPRGWYSAREGAFVAPDIGKSYADLVLEALDFGRGAMADARLAFEATQDIEPLVATGLECTSAILTHAADWLGHRAGLAENAEFAGADLPALLAAWDLADWIELFGRDLAAIYETADGRIDVDRATTTSPHVERLLWTIGLLAWPDRDSVRWLPFDPGPSPVIEGIGAMDEEGVNIEGADPEASAMAKADFEALLDGEASNIALVLGNGINRYGAVGINSWEALLMRIAADCGIALAAVPNGTTLTEFYDVLNLQTAGRTGDLASGFCKLMAKWRPLDHHKSVIGWASRHGVPVLTTNFDEVLSAAARAEFILPRGLPFSDFYPWNARFAHAFVGKPGAAFGIWHANGMARYKRSIRLGLTDYMGAVQRARAMFYRGDKQLFRSANRHDWEGAGGWLDLVFHKPLLFLGLALEENEVFLRWLLIERARYFRKFPHRRQPAWYVFTHDPSDARQAGKRFFLEAVGITTVCTSGYEEVWDNIAWGR